MKALEQVLQNTAANHILPFFWMHGEEEAVLREEMAKIRECGIGAVCLESRPHPQYAGERWWHDVDIIMDEAREHNMRVWILDDNAFPTGSANGTARLADDRLRRRFIRERHIDVCGPLNGASLIMYDHESPEHLVAIAARKHGSDEIECIPLSNVHDSTLYWDVPEGIWRVFFITEQMYGPISFLEGHLNPLIRESTQLLIDAVYEPHYQHYGADFGKTFAGFFSDEPGIYGSTSYFSKVGDPEFLLPWTPSMLQELTLLSDMPVEAFLVCLFEDIEGLSPACRYIFTDHVTRLYRDNFAGLLGDWCRAHGVEYMGHIIEDDNAHGRIGYSAGHFFRALEGQDFSGIDVVLHQIIPGMDEIGHTDSCGGFPNNVADGEFFAYMLAQMAESQAALEPHKLGRAMCEIFGAYGWAEGTKMMKWLTDFMLVRGINYFVPHAFSPREFPDPDCPPHFYAHGINPQFAPFAQLMRYMNRVAHLLSDGVAEADIAVLYHADAEWTTRPCMLSQVPARMLTQAHIPFRFVTLDYLRYAEINADRFIIGGRAFKALVLPYQHTISQELLSILAVFREAGIDVCFVGGTPERVIDHNKESACRTKFHSCQPEQLAERFAAERLLPDAPKDLRIRRYTHTDGAVWFLTNEHPFHSVNTELPNADNCVIYDAMNNIVRPYDRHLVLGPYESCIVVFGEALPAPTPALCPTDWQALPLHWKLSVTESENYPHFRPYQEYFLLQNLNRHDALNRFSGILRYEATFVAAAGDAVLDLGEVYETAEVWVNGKSAGMRIAPPYRFELKDILADGENQLVVEVRNTLGHAQRDHFSRFLIQEPIGLIGPLHIGR